MKILNLSILRDDNTKEEPVYMCSDYELSSFSYFQQGTYNIT